MDKIDMEDLRREVVLSQIDGRMTDKLAIYLMRIHDIVKKKQKKFVGVSEQDMDEAISWSLERWMKSFMKLNIMNYANPFAYFYRGSYLNMLNRLIGINRQRERDESLRKHYMDAIKEEMPSMQLVEGERDEW